MLNIQTTLFIVSTGCASSKLRDLLSQGPCPSYEAPTLNLLLRLIINWGFPRQVLLIKRVNHGSFGQSSLPMLGSRLRS